MTNGPSDSAGGAFSARIERDAALGPVAVLGWDGIGDATRALEARIVPGFGCNLARFSVGDKAVIDYDPALLAARDFTGTPVLYPTPNRVRGCAYSWKGRMYRQERNGTPVYEHGLAHLEAWEYDAPTAAADHARFEARLACRPGTTMYGAFPFTSRLGLTFTLSPRGIHVDYAVANEGGEELPFGFGLHPYFMKLSGDAETFVTVPAAAVMEADADLLPTGRLLDAAGSGRDLRARVPVGTLDLDHVFLRDGAGKAHVEYRSLGMGIEIGATPDFSHFVLYTPRGEPFFCLESQTCSTDAHNLYARGFVKESGLKTVPPGGTHRGAVTYYVTHA